MMDELPTQADELLREIFLHGHSEGWTGNQMRRDVQNVDAEKGWALYVSNGALEKTKERHRIASNTEARLAAIEECAAIAENHSRMMNAPDHMDTAKMIGRAIRALAKPTQGDL